MKIILLGDTHFGARNDSLHFHKFFELFYSNTLFPYMKENQIDTIFQLGDLFDRRKYINFNTLSEVKRYFFDYLKNNNISLYTLLGNHDLYWKESLSVSSTGLLVNDYKNLYMIDKPTNIENLGLCVIPWICKENQEEAFEVIKKSKAHTCLGHFEISGFSMYRGVQSHDGLSMSDFYQFENVFSGHYHHRSSNGNITYVGTPYEMTWQDYLDVKGFHVYDLETRKLTFIENPNTMYYKIEYDDTNLTSDSYIPKEELQKYSEKYIKVIVNKKNNPYVFDNFISSLQSVNPIDVSIIEGIYEFFDEDMENINETEDTLTILSRYIDNIKIQEIETNKAKNIMKDLYEQALRMEIV